MKREYDVAMELVDKAIAKRVRLIERFYDIDESIDEHKRLSVIRAKIISNTASLIEYLEIAELIKEHCDE